MKHIPMQTRTLSSAARTIPLFGSALDELFDTDVDPTKWIAKVFSLMRMRDEMQCEHLVPQALAAGLSPDEVYTGVLHAYGPAGSALATKARLRLAAAIAGA